MEKFRQDLFRFDAGQILACCNDIMAPYALLPPTYTTITDGNGNTIFRENERYTGILAQPKDSQVAAARFDFDPFLQIDWMSFDGDIVNADTGAFVISGRKLAWLWNVKEYSFGCCSEVEGFIGSLVALTLNEAQVWAEYHFIDGALNCTPEFFEKVISVEKLLAAADFETRVVEHEDLVSVVSRFISRMQVRLRRLIPQLTPLIHTSESITQGWNVFVHESYNGACTITNLGDARILEFELKKG